MENKYIFDIYISVFKIINDYLPGRLFDNCPVNHVRGRPTRQSNDLFVKRTKTEAGKKMFSVRGPLHWNKIPQHIKGTATLSSFKDKLKGYFLYIQNGWDIPILYISPMSLVDKYVIQVSKCILSKMY